MFAVEYEDADFEFSDSDEERAPNYVVTPTGARVNRLFAVGVLTEVDPVSDDVLRARIVDPTGAFVAYAGQYQPEAVGFLEAAEVPSFVSLTGKARTFQPDGSDQVFSSVRPESITTVDEATRDRWTVQTAEHTLARIATMARAVDQAEQGQELTDSLRAAGAAEGLAAGIPLAIDHYGTTRAYLSALQQQAIAVTELISSDRDAVPDLDLEPGDDGPVDGDLQAAPSIPGTVTPDADLASSAPEGDSRAVAAETDDSEPAPDVRPEPDATPTETAADLGSEPADEADAGGAELGDFDAPDVDIDASEPAAETYELDEAERKEVEAEFGTEFSTGSEVGEPGEAGIESETSSMASEAASESEAAPASSEGPEEGPVADQSEETASHSDGDASAEAETASEAANDLQDAVLAAVAELDEGAGATREAVVERVVNAHDAEVTAVEAAIQDALMDGRCYEPGDGTLKAI
jgi:RPA family protein